MAGSAYGAKGASEVLGDQHCDAATSTVGRDAIMTVRHVAETGFSAVCRKGDTDSMIFRFPGKPDPDGAFIMDSLIKWFIKFFNDIRDKPCTDFRSGLQNRVQYRYFDSEMIHLMIHSRFRRADATTEGWALEIIQIEFDESLRRQGLGTHLFKWLKDNSPTQFIFVESVLTIEMESFLTKLGARKTSPIEQNWIY